MQGRTRLIVNLEVNGIKSKAEVPSNFTLAELLRERLGLTGTKLGCNRAECGVCTVLLDGRPVFSCSVLAADAEGGRVQTIEGLAKEGHLDPLQEAFVAEDALQCGFCTPGIIMSLKSLLDSEPSPTMEQVKSAVAGNYCRCGAYPNIFRAAMRASEARALH